MLTKNQSIEIVQAINTIATVLDDANPLPEGAKIPTLPDDAPAFAKVGLRLKATSTHRAKKASPRIDAIRTHLCGILELVNEEALETAPETEAPSAPAPATAPGASIN